MARVESSNEQVEFHRTVSLGVNEEQVMIDGEHTYGLRATHFITAATEAGPGLDGRRQDLGALAATGHPGTGGSWVHTRATTGLPLLCRVARPPR